MFLKKIEIHGFKSFAQKTALEFNNGITAIVGPNGSGKSNISDAVRWVLGEQSPKILRGKKSNDVIFVGSKKRSRLGMAEVSLFIDNTSKRAPIEYSEIVITRRVYRNDSSEYFINKNKVRLADVVMLLAKAHFGQKSYAVVGQGMIDRIINLMPQDRKEFFDEAAGVKQYQIKRDQSVNKLIRTEENLERVSGLIAEIEPHLRSLDRQVKKLARREKVLVNLHDIQKQYYGYLWQDTIQNKAREENQLDALKPDRDGLDLEIQKLRSELEAFAHEQSGEDQYQELQRSYDSLLHEKNILIKEQALVESKMSVEEGKQGKAELQWIRSRFQVVEGERKQIKEQLESLNEKILDFKNSLHEKKEKQQGIFETLKEKEYEFLKKKEQAQDKHSLSVPVIRKRFHEIYEQQEKFIELVLQTNSIEEFRNVKRQAKEITVKMADLMDELTEKKNKEQDVLLERLEKDMKEFMMSKDNLVNEVNDIRVRLSGFEERYKIISRSLNEKSQEAKKLSSEIEKIQASEGGEGERIALLQKDYDALAHKIEKKDSEIQEIKKDIDDFNAKQQNRQNKIMLLQKNLQDKQQKFQKLRDDMSGIEVNIARIETRLEDLSSEIEREIPEFVLVVKKGEGFDRPNMEEARNEIHRFKKQLELIGGIDPEIVNEHEEVKTRYEFLTEQYSDLENAVKDLEKIIDTLDVTIKKQFHSSFQNINKNFNKYFRVLFGGGSAKLELVQEEDTKKDKDLAEENSEQDTSEESDFSVGVRKKRKKIISGVHIAANPPGKKLNDVSVLSGGEKALTAIALIAAIIASNPPPFVFLDEVEAALDEANSERFIEIIRDLGQKTQFVVVTHNRATMNAAQRLYGVTMNRDGVSQLLSVELEDIDDKIIGNE